jgi:predicted DNA-binding transcriptional regulator AlpA
MCPTTRIEMTNTTTPETLLPADDLALVDGNIAERVTGLKKSARHMRAQAGTYPKPLQLSSRCSRYRVGDLRRWLQDPFGWQQSMAFDTSRAAT